MPYLTPDNIQKIHDALTFKGDPVEALQLLEKVMPDGEYRASPAEIAAAIEQYGSDEINIDEDATTSRGDNGTWVQAWVWLEFADCQDCDGLGLVGEEGESKDTCQACGGSGKTDEVA